MTNASASPKKWHVGNWTGLGWLETGLKLIAHVVAFIALANALQTTSPAAIEGVRLLQVMLTGFMALGLTVAIGDRLLEKEIIALAFVVINVIAHWSMVYALTRQPGPGTLLTLFAFFMLLGDLVKIVFLQRTQFTVRGFSTRTLIYLTGSFVVMQVILLVLSLMNS